MNQQTPLAVEVDDQHNHFVNKERIVALVRNVFGSLLPLPMGEPYVRVSISAVEKADIARLNEEHMDAVGPTDVLSFPIDGEELYDAAQRSTDEFNDVLNTSPGFDLGDIVVCTEIAHQQAQRHAGNFTNELELLVVHSCLHLVGYDHDTVSKQQEMWNVEQQLCATFAPAIPLTAWDVY